MTAKPWLVLTFLKNRSCKTSRTHCGIYCRGFMMCGKSVPLQSEKSGLRPGIDEVFLSTHRDQSSHLIPGSEAQFLGSRPQTVTFHAERREKYIDKMLFCTRLRPLDGRKGYNSAVTAPE